MWKALYLFALLYSTTLFVYYRHNKSIRTITYKETETEKEAKFSWFVILILCILWTLYFNF